MASLHDPEVNDECIWRMPQVTIFKGS